jgi:hypothetical protein
MGKIARGKEGLTDSEIHRAIVRVFLNWEVGYTRPIPLDNLVDFVCQELDLENWKDRLQVRLLITRSDRYLSLKDGVVANR